MYFPSIDTRIDVPIKIQAIITGRIDILVEWKLPILVDSLHFVNEGTSFLLQMHIYIRLGFIRLKSFSVLLCDGPYNIIDVASNEHAKFIVCYSCQRFIFSLMVARLVGVVFIVSKNNLLDTIRYKDQGNSKLRL